VSRGKKPERKIVSTNEEKGDNEAKKRSKAQEKKKILSQMKGQVLKEHEVICIQQILTVRYGILESQHAYAVIVARCYGMKKD
jgi:hypothetical protein